MPKKLGINSKATEARERRADKKKEEQLRKEKEIEDSYWRDDDKQVNKKLSRKLEKDEKRNEQLQRKKELKQLYEEEFVAGKAAKGASGNSQPSKITQAQISVAQAKIAAELSKLNNDATSSEPEPLPSNPNLVEVDGMEARTVEDAIAVLKVDNDAEADHHPERRMKAAFLAYEEQMMPQLRAENPGMRYSQLKNILFKMFQVAPENPKNQHKS